MGGFDFVGKEKTAIVSSLPPPLAAINEEKHTEEKHTEEKQTEEKREEEATALSCLCCYLCLFGLLQ